MCGLEWSCSTPDHQRRPTLYYNSSLLLEPTYSKRLRTGAKAGTCVFHIPPAILLCVRFCRAGWNVTYDVIGILWTILWNMSVFTSQCTVHVRTTCMVHDAVKTDIFSPRGTTSGICTLTGASIPMGQGGRVPPIFGLGGDSIMNVHPNILRVTSVTFHPCNMFLSDVLVLKSI